MNFILLYKGHYGAALRGPEMRYAALAQELIKKGHSVTLSVCSDDRSNIPSGVGFVPVFNIPRLIKSLFSSDVVVLHGGGPIILLLVIISSLLGKHIVLDGYAPRWIELDKIARSKKDTSQVKLLTKAYFNVMRGFLGTLMFNLIIVANKRQQDMFRGMMAQFTLTQNFPRVVTIPFGCSEQVSLAKEMGRKNLAKFSNSSFSNDDFLIGWLGGAYSWFGLEGVVTEVANAMIKNNKIKIIFFGVNEQRQIKLLSCVDASVKENIIFLPWINFEQRFDYWCGFDISLVWGEKDYENDYASRTRNFDCLTLSLPIIQNYDDEWGPRLQQSGAGIVTCKPQLADTIFDISKDPDMVKNMSLSMRAIAPDFYWSRFTEKLISSIETTPMSIGRKLIGLILFFMMMPAVFTSFIFSFLVLPFQKNHINE